MIIFLLIWLIFLTFLVVGILDIVAEDHQKNTAQKEALDEDSLSRGNFSRDYYDWYTPNKENLDDFDHTVPEGMAQWRRDRMTRLEKFSENNQLEVTDLTSMILYLIWELENIPSRLANIITRRAAPWV